MRQLVVIIDIFIAERDAENALTAAILETNGDARYEADRPSKTAPSRTTPCVSAIPEHRCPHYPSRCEPRTPVAPRLTRSGPMSSPNGKPTAGAA